MSRILHGFADHGTESEVLQGYGTVTRATLDPHQHKHSKALRLDLSEPQTLPFKPNTFDFALLHPPCTPWATMPGANKDGDAPELIEEAREIGTRYATHYVIENKPSAPLRDPVTLSGKMFGLPIEYERAFEASFAIEQPPQNATLGQTCETSPFFYSEKSGGWWQSVKGYTGGYPKEHLAKNCLPAPYVHHVMRCWLDYTEQNKGTSDYSDYDARMDEKRAREVNAELAEFTDD